MSKRSVVHVEIPAKTREETAAFYLSSDDIDADLKRVEELGGKTLMPKMSIGEHGWIAMFSEPTGNMLAFWSSNG